MFRIGEFTKIAQVTGRQLRHYDEIGLFTPAYTDSKTGYRYYTAEQLPQLNRILALKELGLSLDQVQRLLDEDVSSDEIRGMLTMRKAQVEQTLREELARFRYIESRIEQIDNQGHLGEYDIVLKSVPKLRYLGVRETFPRLLDAQLLGLEMHRLLPAKVGRAVLGNFTVIIYSEFWEDNDLDMEIGFVLEDDFEDNITISEIYEMRVRELPAVEEILTVARVGMPNLGHGSYSALGMWMSANNYRFTGQGREVYFQFPFPDRLDETVTEIQFPVEKIDNFQLP